MANKGNVRKLGVMCTFTFLLFLAELIVGYMVHSLALVADAFHMLSDLLALIIAIVALKLTERNRSEYMTYGWVRTEILGGLINGILLLALCFNIIIDAIQRFFEPEKIKQPVLLLIVASIGLGFNIIGLFIFSGHASHGHSHGHGHGHGHGHSHGHKHKHDKHKHKDHDHDKKKRDSLPSEDTPSAMGETAIQLTTIELAKQAETTHIEEEGEGSSATMHSVFLHVLGDALGSLAVIGSALFIWLTNFSWRYYIDPAVSIVISLVLMRSSVRLIKSTSLVILQSVPGSVDMKAVREEITKVRGVLGVHELHVWQLDEQRYICTVHIASDADDDMMDIGQQVKDILHRHGVHNTTVQQELIHRTHSDNDTTPLEHVDSETCALVCPETTCRKRVCCTEPTH